MKPNCIHTIQTQSYLISSFNHTPFVLLIQETILAAGMKAEVFIEQGGIQQENPCDFPSGLVGVLTAGNFDAPIDILHALFFRNQVCSVKLNIYIKERR